MPDAYALDPAFHIVKSLLGNRLSYPVRERRERYYSPVDRIHLSGVPTVAVSSVTDHNGQAVEHEAHYSTVILTGNLLAPGWLGAKPCKRDPYVEVQYTYGYTDLPDDVARAVAVLSSELILAQEGKPCRLPERVTSVNRQGVSWTMLDPQDFLDDGRTGLYEVDLVLSAHNRGKARARARVFSPEYRPPLLLWDKLATT